MRLIGFPSTGGNCIPSSLRSMKYSSATRQQKIRNRDFLLRMKLIVTFHYRESRMIQRLSLTVEQMRCQETGGDPLGLRFRRNCAPFALLFLAVLVVPVPLLAQWHDPDRLLDEA